METQTIQKLRQPTDTGRFNSDAERNFISPSLVVITNGKAINPNWIQHNHPFLTSESRVMLVVAGQYESTVNMQRHRLSVGQMMYVPTGSIIEVNDAFGDFDLRACTVRNQPTSRRYGQPRVWAPSEQVQERFGHYLQLMLSMAKEQPLDMHGITLLHEAMLHDIHTHAADLEAVPSQSSPQQQVVNNFIALVNAHAAMHRDVDFYADRLCISASRLMHIVKQVSGQTVMQWINRRTVLHAKSLLWYHDKPVGEIADELHFESASHFTRFFRRETGLTPTEYRNKGKKD